MLNDINRREKSEFNMAVSYLNRLNTLLQICDESSMSLNYYSWLHSLQALKRELTTEMQAKEFLDITQLANETANLVNQDLNNTTKNKRSMFTKSPIIYQKLDELETKLRRVLKDSGLQMKMQEEASKALR